MSATGPALRELSAQRRTATLLATVRQLEVDAVDDALDLFELLMATKLLARAERLGQKAKLKTLPVLRRAAVKIAAAVAILLEIPQASGGGMVSLAQAWEEIEQVIPREELTAAVEQLSELVPDGDDDDDAEWREELVKRYASVTGFLGLLAQIQFGAIDARVSVIAVARRSPELVGRRRVLGEELDGTLVAGSWRRLVFANPELPAGAADHRAFVFCVLGFGEEWNRT